MPRSRSKSRSRGRRSSHRSPERSHRSARRPSHSRSHSKSKYKSSTSSKGRTSRHRSHKHSSRSPTRRHERRSSYDRRRRRSSSSSDSASDHRNYSSSSSSSSRSSRTPSPLKRVSANKIRLENTLSQPVTVAFQSAMNYLDAPMLPEAIEAIDAEGFVQRVFTSSNSNKISDKVLIDLASETISVPKAQQVDPNEDMIFHSNVRPLFLVTFLYILNSILINRNNSLCMSVYFFTVV